MWELSKVVAKSRGTTTLILLDEQNFLLTVPSYLTKPLGGRGGDGCIIFQDCGVGSWPFFHNTADFSTTFRTSPYDVLPRCAVARRIQGGNDNDMFSGENEVGVSMEQAKMVAAVQTRSMRQVEAVTEAAAAVVVVEEDSGDDTNNSNGNEEEDEEENTNVLSAAELIDTLPFGTQMYLGAGGAVAARAEMIDDVGERQTEQMISVVHNVIVKAIHTLFPQDALGSDKAYLSAPCSRKTFDQERGKMGSYAEFTANTAITNLL